MKKDKSRAYVVYIKPLAEPNDPFLSIKLDELNPDFHYEIAGESEIVGGDKLMNISLAV